MVSRKLQESQGKYSLFLPTAIVEALEWEKGHNIEVKLGKGRCIELCKKNE